MQSPEAYLREALEDAKSWMTKYQIEKELNEKIEAENKRLIHINGNLHDRTKAAERKAKVLANCLAVILDSEEFIA